MWSLFRSVQHVLYITILRFGFRGHVTIRMDLITKPFIHYKNAQLAFRTVELQYFTTFSHLENNVLSVIKWASNSRFLHKLVHLPLILLFQLTWDSAQTLKIGVKTDVHCSFTEKQGTLLEVLLGERSQQLRFSVIIYSLLKETPGPSTSNWRSRNICEGILSHWGKHTLHRGCRKFGWLILHIDAVHQF